MLINLVVACYRCLSQCLWLCLARPLLCLYLLYTWVHSSVCVCVCYVCAYAWFIGSSVALTVGVAGLFAPLSVSAVCLGLFLRLCLRLLCLCLYLVCRLLRRCDCGYGWVVCPLSVPALCLGLFLRLRLHLLYLCLCLICLLLRRFVCSCAWVVRSSVYVCYVPGSVPPFASASAIYLCLCLIFRLLRLHLLCF